MIGRNSFIGESNWTISARLSKDVQIGTRRLTGMIEAFNLTNRVNLTGYNNNIGGTTGLVTDLSGIVPNAADLMRQVAGRIPIRLLDGVVHDAIPHCARSSLSCLAFSCKPIIRA